MVLDWFSKKFAGRNTVRASFSVNVGSFLPKDERKAYHEEQRRDEAAIFRRNNRQLFKTPTPSTEPICPYCESSLGDRESPQRRSRFRCKSCGGDVWVDPWQRLYKSVYLNARRGLICQYLGMLDDCPATAGTFEDFVFTARSLKWTQGKKVLNDNQVADVLWGLMNYNVMNIQDILPREELSELGYYAEKLQKWIAEYREEEKRVRSELKEFGKAKKKGRSLVSTKVKLLCPYCGNDLGAVGKPARRSKRKCKSCDKQIHVHPKQSLFNTPFLTTRQVTVVEYLEQLDHWVFTRGSMSDFRREVTRRALSGELSDDQTEFVVLSLIRWNMVNIAEINKQEAKREEERHKLLKGTPGYKPYSSIKSYREDVRGLMEQYEQDLAELT